MYIYDVVKYTWPVCMGDVEVGHTMQFGIDYRGCCCLMALIIYNEG